MWRKKNPLNSKKQSGWNFATSFFVIFFHCDLLVCFSIISKYASTLFTAQRWHGIIDIIYFLSNQNHSKSKYQLLKTRCHVSIQFLEIVPFWNKNIFKTLQYLKIKKFYRFMCAFRNYQDMYKNRVKKILKFQLFCLVNGKIQSGRIQNIFLYTYPGKVHIERKKLREK